MLHKFWKPLSTLALCAAIAPAWAGQTMLFIGDDMSGLSPALDQAINAAIAAQDSPVVLIIKDTQVSQAVQGSPLQATLKDGLANRVQMFVCEADLVRYGISASKLLPGLAVIKAPVAKTDSPPGTPVEIQPLQRFKKQAEKVCEQ